ncbi:CoA-substrate-specific enzyme activase [Oleidesulfovibrio alaskensis G20]|uniref:CoA-substrate-specific enzyme activase n=1 Tax=Oleidesulfovibrio alaskensis (strain ATCC BAA-1058 / DSM 17464 / G20) TaxID=207559 RepID=Q317K6_OLEA2|nr:acyl-CoA dehydratase activase [Oleidesulfovibrio alaskensis]ABB36890.1 CoA-substrate-specific enzyme activase [Oleidesulfovibrio alaskensis G20]MBG0774166.1 3-hydroxyacyl-ACP dehydratase [Oleidesulfovibrio alaskensis]
MLTAGIDIGSRSIELVVQKDGTTVHSARSDTTFDPRTQVRAVMQGWRPDILVATGYGRALVEQMDMAGRVETVTEIKAHALGAASCFPQARTVLDIGGQDTKAIALSPQGKVARFEMNDRCAAGTGKFLEYTATVFQIPVAEFGLYALKGQNPPVISSMCTVFAETEATSLMAQGIAAPDIALGLHCAIARRTLSMLDRIDCQPPLVFAGGVARNPCMRMLIARELRLIQDETLLVADRPDMNGALGAAVHALRLATAG